MSLKLATRLLDAKRHLMSVRPLLAAVEISRHLARTTCDLVFPPRCVLCDADLAGDSQPSLCCSNCIVRLAPETWIGCPRCGSEQDTPRPEMDCCPLCKRHSLWFDAVVPLGSYDAGLRDVVLHMKRPAHETLSITIGRLLAERRRKELTDLRPDLIVPIPMYWMRRFARGTNSPEVLCDCMSKLLQVPANKRLLARRRNTRPQKDLRPSERFQNMEGAFRVQSRANIQNTRVLLVDDILTTGATCSEAARMLKEAGASMVAVAVVARAQGDKRNQKMHG